MVLISFRRKQEPARMAQRDRSSFRNIAFVSVIVVALYLLGFFQQRTPRSAGGEGSTGWQPVNHEQEVLNGKVDYDSLFLTEEQCRAAFPGLNKEIEERVEKGPFLLERVDDYMGSVQGRIKDGKLYIISASNDASRQKLDYRAAALHQLHRALITSPKRLPDTVFSLCVNDFPRNNTWSFSKWNDEGRNDWLMPHFSFWSWSEPYIGVFDETVSKIKAMERDLAWKDKIAKAVWRGTVWFNPIGNKGLRGGLLKATKGKQWADTEALRWENGKAANALKVEEFCRYKYIIYTEGVTYSGRLHYHQACTSVIITPPPTFLVHTSHLMKPLFSSSLPLSQPPSPYLSEVASINRTWPRGYDTSTANVVFVAPDWSDLEATIEWLERNPDVAEGIAQRGRREMIGGGYLSAAAEVCYWRALVEGWSKVVRVDESDWQDEGIRWETFSIRGKVGWE